MIPVLSTLLLGLVLELAPTAEEPSAEQALVVEALRLETSFDEIEAGLPAELDRIRLEALGPLFEALCTETIPAAWHPTDGRLSVLDDGRLQAIEDSLEGVAVQHLRVHFRVLAGEEERPELRVRAFEMLGLRGAAIDEPLMLKLATPVDSDDGVLPRALRKSFELALFGLVVRDRSTLAEIERSYPGAHEGLRSTLVDVLGQLGTEESLATLANLLGHAREHDPYILKAMAHTGHRVRHPVQLRVRSLAREHLRSFDRNVVLCAARAVAALEDFDSIPALLELMENGDEGEVHVARRSLARMTRLQLGDDASRWRHWYESERDWWIDESDATLESIRNADSQETNEAITNLASRRLDRHRVAEALLTGLHRSESVALELTCHALGATESWVGVPALVDALEHELPAVQWAAHRALTRITGLTLPADPSLWRLQVGQRT